jgi:membrane fusion protein (multidrug efflux system)
MGYLLRAASRSAKRAVTKAGAVAVLGLAAAVAAAAVPGCKRAGEGGAGMGPPPPTEVTYVTVKPTSLPVEYEFIGQTDASQSVPIRARIRGFLTSRTFEEGGSVEKDQVLFTIDPREFAADQEMARSALERAEAKLKRWDREVARLTEAVAGSAAARKELDDAATEQLQARADVRMQKATVQSKDLDVSYTEIKSPLTGVIGRRMKDTGSLVDADQNSMLATVWQLDPLYVNFSVSERDYVTWKQDVEAKRVLLPPDGKLSVEISLIDGTPYPYAGELDFADVQINPQTGSAPIRASFANPPIESVRGADHMLKPGQFVKGKIVGWQRPNSVSVPQVSVIQGPTGAYVYVIGAGDKAELRPVTTGGWAGGDWVILTGLTAGDKVVAEGAGKLDMMAKMMPAAMVKGTPAAPSTRPATAATKPTVGPTSRPARRPAGTPAATHPAVSGTSGGVPGTWPLGSPLRTAELEQR